MCKTPQFSHESVSLLHTSKKRVTIRKTRDLEKSITGAENNHTIKPPNHSGGLDNQLPSLYLIPIPYFLKNCPTKHNNKYNPRDFQKSIVGKVGKIPTISQFQKNIRNNVPNVIATIITTIICHTLNDSILILQ